MGNKYNGCTVVFDDDLEEHTFESIRNAIELIKGVKTVKPIICDSNLYIERESIKMDFIKNIVGYINRKE